MKQPSLLFVDDEPINRLIFAKSLEDHIPVILAESGAEGLVKLDQHPEIIIVVSDYSMPEMSGVEFIEEAKKKFPKLPCYTHSAVVWDETIEAALDAGLIKKHFPKPMDLPSFLVEVELALALSPRD